MLVDVFLPDLSPADGLVRATIASCLAAAIFLAVPTGANASSDNAGKAIAIALPIAAGGATLLHDWDWKGVEQLTLDTGLTVGTVLILKQIAREQRPDHSDFRSFPSLTTAVAFAPASYLWDRYGWEYGAPAYLAAGYAGYSVVNAREHHWWGRRHERGHRLDLQPPDHVALARPQFRKRHLRDAERGICEAVLRMVTAVVAVRT